MIWFFFNINWKNWALKNLAGPLEIKSVAHLATGKKCLICVPEISNKAHPPTIVS
jgi:hypothetical protein